MEALLHIICFHLEPKVPLKKFSTPDNCADPLILSRLLLPGIGPSAAAPSGLEPPIVTAFKAGVIAAPVATWWQANATAMSAPDIEVRYGEFTYGGVDSENCGPVPVYHPIAASQNQSTY